MMSFLPAQRCQRKPQRRKDATVPGVSLRLCIFAVQILSAAALATLVAQIPSAQADSDLDQIPLTATPPATNAPPSNLNVYLQSDLALTALRNNLAVPLPPPVPPQWEARMFLDARWSWQIGDDVDFVYSGRFNLRVEDGLAFPNHEDVRHDLREAYFGWANGNGIFLQLGRINLKSGVALGFNPTDFFKTRAIVEPLSADPTVLREDRLGAFMLQGQAIWTGGAVTFAFAPKLADESPLYANDDLPGFDPMAGRTNAHTRALIKASVDLFESISPEFLVYHEADRTQFGLNVTKSFGHAIVGYVEWAGGNSDSLAERAYRDGRQTGILPLSSPIPASDSRTFANDLAIGASWATKLGITFDVEYDRHQTGFSASDWHNWFDAGGSGNPYLPGELWFIRGYAVDRQESMARNSAFLRADWPHAFVHDLALSAFVDTDFHDGSGLAQVTADYYLSPQWTVGALADVNLGARCSDFGSLPQTVSTLLKVTRYF
jgi:hypothetical protein